MPSYPKVLPIHPFWITLAYGILVGYEVRKHHIDEKIMDALHARQEKVVRQNARITLDEYASRGLFPVAVVKAADGSQG